MVGAVVGSPRKFTLAYPFVIAAIAAVAACTTADLKPASGQQVGDPSGEGPVLDEEGNPVEPGVGDAGRDPAPATKLAVSSAVTIQVQPTDTGAALLAAIKGAKKSVHMTMYLLTSDAMIDALVDLKKAGKDVKVLLNQVFPSNGGDNTPAYNTLKSKGVPVEWASPTYTFTHSKTIIIDAAQVLIMTMNLTYSSPTTNREYIATDTDPQDVADTEKVFTADYTKTPLGPLSSKLVVSPASANTIEPRAQLKALIDSAQTSLAVEAQSLSDSTIVDAIILAHQAKVDVKVVIDLDTSKTSAQLKTIAKLKLNGVPLRALHNPDIHAKAIVVDEKLTFVGSQNMTATALDSNREIGVITDAKAEATKVRGVITSDFDKGVVP
jgi:cardiolipin synthase